MALVSPAERHQARVPAHLHAGLGKLLGEGYAAVAAEHEDEEVFFLEFAGDLHGGLDVGGRADNRGETGDRAVDEVDAALAEFDVVGPRPARRPRWGRGR